MSPAVTKIVINQHTTGPLNGAVALLIGVYLMAVVFQGNGPAFRTAIAADMFGPSPTGHGGGFAYWLIAFLILYALATRDTTRWFGGPLFGLALVGMLISLQTNAGSFISNIVNFAKSPGTAPASGSQAGGSTTQLANSAE